MLAVRARSALTPIPSPLPVRANAAGLATATNWIMNFALAFVSAPRDLAVDRVPNVLSF